MGTKGNGLIIKDPHTLECAGKAQRRRRFFPLNSRKTARQRSGLRQPSGAFGVNKPQRNLPLVAQFPSFSHHHNLLVINASRARSCQIVVAGLTHDAQANCHAASSQNRSAGLRPGTNTCVPSPPEKSYPPRPNSAYFGFVSETLNVNEIYLSLQGESTFAGLPCIFVRLTACNLRCSYCDSAYAFTEGKKQSLEEIRAEIDRLAKPFIGKSIPLTPGFSPVTERRGTAETVSTVSGTAHSSLVTHHSSLPLVELTGGEPLLQKNALPLMAQLCDAGFTVLLETSGAHDISAVDPRVRRIMDLKCPSSGEVERNRWENLAHLKATDEIKFVVGTVEDYAWVKEQIAKHKLAAICPLLVSWVHPLAPDQQDKSLKKVPTGQTPVTRLDLVEKIIADALPVRFQAQLHKIIWPPEQRGV
jgi:7-carboxy-7-deazaguanine synthase